MANRSFLVVESFEGVAAPCAAGGAKRPPQGIPKGIALGAPLVTFPATGKSPGVEGRSALSSEGVGAVLPRGECRGAQPLALRDRPPGVEGRSALLMGVVGARGPHLGSEEPSLTTCSRGAQPLALRDSSPGSEGRSALLWVERRGGLTPSSQGSPGAPTRPSVENKGVVSRRGLTSPECTAPQCCGQRRCPPASASPHIRRAQR